MAIETVIVPTKAEHTTAGGKPCLEIAYKDDGKDFTKRIFNPSLYNLFAVNLPVKIQLERQGNYWNITGAESVKDVVEANGAIEKQGDEYAPQEIGMWWKEAGEVLRHLDPELKTHPMYIDLKNAYLHKMFDVLGIPMKHKAKGE